MIRHDGKQIPTDPVVWDQDQKEWITFSWDDQASERNGILSSEFLVPDGWTKNQTRTDVATTDLNGRTYNNCNQVLLSCDTQDTDYVSVRITNRVTFGDDSQLDRSVDLIVDET